MILKNLFRRKGRIFLTLTGIAIGVAAIVALGAVARGMKTGFAAITQGIQADLVLSQAEAMSALLSSIDQELADQVRALPEVADIDGMLLTNALLDDTTMLMIFGYDPEGFAIDHFRIVGIYETGNGSEDGAAVIPLQEAQALALQPRRISQI